VVLRRSTGAIPPPSRLKPTGQVKERVVGKLPNSIPQSGESRYMSVGLLHAGGTIGGKIPVSRGSENKGGQGIFPLVCSTVSREVTTWPPSTKRRTGKRSTVRGGWGNQITEKEKYIRDRDKLDCGGGIGSGFVLNFFN